MSGSPFELIRSKRIESLNVDAREYRHTRTDARHLHLATEDTNNVFCVAFLTTPRDSTGVAHILEHTTLCGSRRFPVRDPFFMMTRRSLNTFMNAFTGADYTAYPFASQNRKDFDNLLQVYLDAVFFPHLDELDFAQEGHRVEFEVPDDPSTELLYKGVVYNEMKGAMSSPHAVLWHALCSAMFPTTTYGQNSGGEPTEIPKLSYQMLKDFHTRHYHPSNAFFTTYGDFPEAEHQQNFHDWALRFFEARDRAPDLPDELRFTAPKTISIPYACNGANGLDGRTHIIIGWLLGKTTNPRELIRMHLLDGLLMDNSASPLQHILETTPLGRAPSELNGLGLSTREATFICGLEGSDTEHADEVEKLILDVIAKVASDGVPEELIESVLHQLELEQREIPGGTYPYGLRMAEAATSSALRSGDPIAGLDIDPLLTDLRRQAKTPGFVQDLVRRMLLDNTHRARVIMMPDGELDRDNAQRERDTLGAMKDAMDAEEKNRTIEKAAALAERQQANDDPGSLPKVELSDIPSELKIPQGEQSRLADIPLTWFEAATNGLVYQHIVIALPELSTDELEILNFYCDCLTNVGIGTRGYLQVQTWQAEVCGGISASCTVIGAVEDVQKSHAYLWIDGSGLPRNHPALVELMYQTFSSARFDELDRLRELIAQNRANAEASITDYGHALAMTAACQGMNPAARVSHLWGGLLGIKRLKALDDRLDDRAVLADLSARLTGLHNKVKQSAPSLLTVGGAAHKARYARDLANVWREHSAAGKDSGFRLDGAPTRSQQAWVTNTQVNFCARAYPTVPAAHLDAPVLAVLGRFMQNGYLHGAIREQGGAYGAGAGYDSTTGAFRFFSYRDPRLAETIADFDRSLAWLIEDRHQPQHLEEAILGVIGTIDRPGSPASNATEAFVAAKNGRSPEHRQRFRGRVMEITLADLLRVAEVYLQPEAASTAVISSQNMVNACPALGLKVYSI